MSLDFARIVLTFQIVLSMAALGACSDGDSGGATLAADAAPDAAELHCDSWLTWCEGGVVYRAYPDHADDATCGASQQACSAADFGARATVLETCPGACIDEFVCAWCESTDQPGCSGNGAPRDFCVDGLDGGVIDVDAGAP